MPLEDLITVIERLKERIQQQGSILSQNEMLTRYILIDPLLRALGWDTEDPTLVRPEYQSQYGRADYVLLSDGKQVAIIEAKKLNESISGNAIGQAINYCLQEGTRYFVITNGRQWDVYETHKPVPIEQKKIHSLDISQGTSAQVALKALALWNRDFADNPSYPIIGGIPQGVTTPPMPITAPAPVPASHSEVSEGNQKIPEALNPERVNQPHSEGAAVEGWVTLEALNPSLSDQPPKMLRFPDGQVMNLTVWADLQRAVAKWLVARGKLTPEKVPILLDEGSTQYLVNTEKRHPSGGNLIKANK